ncbi:MAG TPA: ATP-binding protein [Polyangiaceae bacterium]|nr:ATP-binding protein [Polyangiaceae bacterium]
MRRTTEAVLALVQPRRSIWVRFGIGTGAALLGIAFRSALSVWLGDGVPWITFFPMVLASAVLAGGVAATTTIALCSVLGTYLFATPVGAWPRDAQQWVSLLAFVGNSSLVACLGVALRLSLARLEASRSEARRIADSLAERERELTLQVADLTQLHHFGTAVVGMSSRDELLKMLLAAAVRLQSGERGFIELFDSITQRLALGVSFGHADSAIEALTSVPVADGEGACGTCAARRTRVIVEDTEQDPLFTRYRDAARRAGFRAVWSTPLLTRRGELLGVLSTHFAEPKRPSEREVQLVELYARLAADAAEAAMIHARADEARLQAEAAAAQLRDQDRRKDEFLAMLGHELRNPLAAIRAVVDIAQLRGRDSISGRELQVLDRQSTALARMLDDLLDVARITHDKIDLQRTQVSVQAAVTRAVDSARAGIERRRHDLRIVLPPEPLFVEGDPMRIEQVLVNLLGNAAKYTEPGGRIELHVTHEDDTIRIQVRDNGRGLAPGSENLIFDLFQQDERKLDRAGGGLGLGLTIVKKLVELHGGRVFATSAGLGQGSQFTVELPELRVSSQLLDADTARADGLRDATSLRVLIVDDNVDAAASLAALLEFYGYSTRVAHDGPKAIELAREYEPQVVFLDIGLPEMDGYAVAASLRCMGAVARIVAVTGYGESEARARSLAVGISEHWIKPVDGDEVLKFLAAFARDNRSSPLQAAV